MDRQYSEAEILLVMNYDTHGRRCLSFDDRCRLHQLANDRHFNRSVEMSEHLRGVVASVLTEIAYRKYEYVNAKYVYDKELGKLLLIKKF